MKLFFTPEDTDDPVNNAKRYFLQTGMSTKIVRIFMQSQYYEVIRCCCTGRYFLFSYCFMPLILHSVKLNRVAHLKIIRG